MEDMENLEYLVKDEIDTYGPMRLSELEFKMSMGEIPDSCFYRSTMEDEWHPITDLKKKLGERSEGSGLMPGKTDALFFFGLVLFFFGAAVFFFNKYAGDGVLLLSLAAEIGAVVLSFKREGRTAIRTVGNIIALMWAGFQALITLGFIIATFS
ncbi:MAG TPA: hypothetical protein ENK47_06270 [Euryarchaeota archaeon]|nr:MAG: hypothetical protein B6U90_06700 [Thermoplasmatales archaeon ex4484_6]RLF67899.1 MAG: hypothetical protein DRN57_05120 [Thermoplasmata archaeon]HHD16298.1 hypothetical protein [Euryarchaeota archaeon]